MLSVFPTFTLNYLLWSSIHLFPTRGQNGYSSLGRHNISTPHRLQGHNIPSRLTTPNPSLLLPVFRTGDVSRTGSSLDYYLRQKSSLTPFSDLWSKYVLELWVVLIIYTSDTRRTVCFIVARSRYKSRCKTREGQVYDEVGRWTSAIFRRRPNGQATKTEITRDTERGSWPRRIWNRHVSQPSSTKVSKSRRYRMERNHRQRPVFLPGADASETK